MSDREEPLDPERIYAVAEEHLKSGELHEARHQFRRAFQYGADPSGVPVLVDMAELFTAREWWREAEESLLEALRVDPDNEPAESMLRELHSQPDRFCGIRPEYDEEMIQRCRDRLTLSRVPRIQLFIELTNRCNGRCTTCLNRSMKRERGVMDFELFKKIVTESSERLYLELVHLYGVGEDYLIPNVLEYLDYAVRKYAERGIRTCLITNGERITDLPEGISVVDISFNGGTRDTYERITGIPFEKTLGNIYRLEREGQLDSNKNIRMLVFNENEPEVEDFKRLFACTSAKLALAYKFDNQCGKIEDKTVEECRSAWRLPCHYVRGVMNITWKGDVILCPHDFEGAVKYGNAGEQSLTDIWYSASHREMLKKHAARAFEGICKECNFNVPIEGKVLEVSREERIALRKRHLDYAVETMVGCSHSSTCEIVREYRDHIEDREKNPDEPLVRICSDDYRFYGIRTVMDNEKHTYCPELKRLRQSLRASRVCWESPTFGPSGYAFASRGYLIGASDLGLRVRSQPLLGDCRMAEIDEEGLDDEWRKIEAFVADQYMAVAMKSPVDKPTLSRLIQLTNTPLGGVYVCGHIPTDHEGNDFYRQFRERNPAVTAHVGYTMFETDHIPELWVEPCNRMDEIWVPCRFNVETFAQSGVARDKLHVIPIGFQPEHYQPERCEPLDSVKRKGFNFLSIFEWTYRKGWDVLIRAYLQEFGEDEDVKLILRAYQGGGVVGQNVPPVSEQLIDFITTLGYDPERIPDIELLDQMVPARDMPRLYKVGDAFVLPTRGEGWGIPLTEAMLMEMPVIATRWSGHLEFMNDENAYLIDVDRIVPVHPDQVRDNPLYHGQHWAEPSVLHTREVMRHVFENRQEGKEKARLGRRHIAENFTIHHAAAKIQQRVAAHENRRSSRVQHLEEGGGTNPEEPVQSRAAKTDLRVLFQARVDLFTVPGGDTEVVVNLKRSLEGQGVTVDFSANPKLPLDDYDLVHIFNFGTPFALNVCTQKKPYVCTPLYEDVQRYMVRANATAAAFREYLETHEEATLESALNRTVCRGTLKVLPDNRFMMDQANAVFLSGASEGQRIRQDFPNVERTQVLKFGFHRPADPDTIDAGLFRSEYGVRDYVLCVGRLETRKNQLMLLRALQDTDIPVVFVNGATPQPGYEELCKGFERAGQTLFTGRVSREMLLSAYKGAKVHALPSWYELPGLVSLEAAWLGCNVVASTWGTVGDYLGDHYYPCEPDDPSSIREAVERAMVTPYEPVVRDMLEPYTLDHFTRKTMKQYQKVLSTSKTRKADRRFRERAVRAERELAYHRLKGRAMSLVDRDPKKAEEEASRLLRYRCDDPTLHFIKGAASVLSCDYERGESHLKKSIDLFPCVDIRPYFYLAALLRQQGRHPEAVDVLLAARRAFVSLPDDAASLLQEQLRSSYAALMETETEDQKGLMATGTQ